MSWGKRRRRIVPPRHEQEPETVEIRSLDEFEALYRPRVVVDENLPDDCGPYMVGGGTEWLAKEGPPGDPRRVLAVEAEIEEVTRYLDWRETALHPERWAHVLSVCSLPPVSGPPLLKAATVWREEL